MAKGGATKGTMYMSKGGATKGTKYMAKGGATKGTNICQRVAKFNLHFRCHI